MLRAERGEDLIGKRGAIAAGILVIIVFFSLAEPFNLSDSGLARLFTTYRLITYAFALLVFYSLARRRIRGVLTVPGLVLLVLGLCAMVVSDFVAQDPAYGYTALPHQFAYVMIYLLSSVAFATFRRVEAMLVTIACATTALLLLSQLGLFTMGNLLPNTSAAYRIVTAVQSQSGSTGVAGSADRATLAWSDANNLGYTLDFAIVTLATMLLSRPMRVVPRMALSAILLFFLATLVSTSSRGASLAMIVGLLPVAIWAGRLRIRAAVALIALLGLFAGASLQLPEWDALRVLQERSSLGLSLIGLGDPGMELGGLETARAYGAQLAWGEFLDNPILGHGSRPAGWMVDTGNHLYYVSLLARWGLVGFLLQSGFVALILWRLLVTTLRLKAQGHQYARLCVPLLAIQGIFLIKGLFAPLSLDYAILGGITTALCLAAAREARVLHGTPQRPLDVQEGACVAVEAAGAAS